MATTTTPDSVRKRDGSIVPFDDSKIENALRRAAFDVLGRRRQVDYQRLSDRLQRTTLEVELTNRSAQEVTVQVDEALPGDWKITDSTHRFEKLDANRARFSPVVPAGGKAVVRFTVEYI